MNKLVILFVIVVSLFLFGNMHIDNEAPIKVEDNASVWEIQKALGKEASNHEANLSVRGASIENGRSIVTDGISIDSKGKKHKKQSKHFVCTSCHNIEKEDPDLSVNDPQARLESVSQKGIPFLQGSPLYGAVNRTSFYNDDYEKKYGELVTPARNNLREAIQLCAVECSQGRRLMNWEVESVLAYLWSLELKMGDLDLTAEDYKVIQVGINEGKEQNHNLINLIDSKYLQASRAHFTKPPENRKEGYVVKGNPDNGKRIYEVSCQHCHYKKKYSFFDLDDSKKTFKFLKRHFKKHSRYSVYGVARKGTSPTNGKKAYMPQYTIEKMTDQQVEDLRAYIEQQAQ